MSLSKSIDFTDPSSNRSFHALLYFPVDFPDRDSSVVVFHWLVFASSCFFLVGGLSFQLLLMVILLVGTYLVFPLNYLACSFLCCYFVLLNCLVLHHYLHQKFYSVFPLVVPVYNHLDLGLERPCCLSYPSCIPELICKGELLHNCLHI